MVNEKKQDRPLWAILEARMGGKFASVPATSYDYYWIFVVAHLLASPLPIVSGGLAIFGHEMTHERG